jgi:hypothetical protein
MVFIYYNKVKRNKFKKIIKTFGYLDFFSYLCTTKTIKTKRNG